ncbi:hypothetical protein ACWGH4_33055 [Streptomyces sp. NPDC054847]
MNDVGRGAWTAALQLFNDSYTVVAVSARIHADWRYDAVATLRRERNDPRGWEAVWWDEYDHTPDRPFFPFRPTDAASFDSGLAEITEKSAATLLVSMSADSFRVSRIDDFSHKRSALLEQARTLLSRFGSRGTFYTNSGYARDAADHDFFESAAWVNPYSEHAFDLGLVALTDDEVGIFWSFDAS